MLTSGFFGEPPDFLTSGCFDVCPVYWFIWDGTCGVFQPIEILDCRERPIKTGDYWDRERVGSSNQGGPALSKSLSTWIRQPGGSITSRGRSTASTWQRAEGSGSSGRLLSFWPWGSTGSTTTTTTTSSYRQIEATTALLLYLFHILSQNILFDNVFCTLLLQPLPLLKPLYLFTLIC